MALMFRNIICCSSSKQASTRALSPFSFSPAYPGLRPDVGFERFHFLCLSLKLGFRVRKESVEFPSVSQEQDDRVVQFPGFRSVFIAACFHRGSRDSSLLGLGHAIRHVGSNHSPSLSKAFFVGQPFRGRTTTRVCWRLHRTR